MMPCFSEEEKQQVTYKTNSRKIRHKIINKKFCDPERGYSTYVFLSACNVSNALIYPWFVAPSDNASII
jgi:hypothetical protein